MLTRSALVSTLACGKGNPALAEALGLGTGKRHTGQADKYSNPTQNWLDPPFGYPRRQHKLLLPRQHSTNTQFLRANSAKVQDLPSSCDPPTLGTRCVPTTEGRTFPKTCLLVKETKAPRIEQHDGHVRIV